MNSALSLSFMAWFKLYLYYMLESCDLRALAVTVITPGTAILQFGAPSWKSALEVSINSFILLR